MHTSLPTCPRPTAYFQPAHVQPAYFQPAHVQPAWPPPTLWAQASSLRMYRRHSRIVCCGAGPPKRGLAWADFQPARAQPAEPHCMLWCRLAKARSRLGKLPACACTAGVATSYVVVQASSLHIQPTVAGGALIAPGAARGGRRRRPNQGATWGPPSPLILQARRGGRRNASPRRLLPQRLAVSRFPSRHHSSGIPIPRPGKETGVRMIFSASLLPDTFSGLEVRL